MTGTLCQCGCGRPAPLQARGGRGRVRGEPVRFIRGHNRRLPLTEGDAYVVDPSTSCWTWQLHTEVGYGRLKRDGKRWLAHVFFYVQRHGPVPSGLELDHLCRNPACVNPDHLEAVTHIENVRRGATTKLSDAQVAEIRASVGPSHIVAERFGVSGAHVRDLRAGGGRRESAA